MNENFQEINNENNNPISPEEIGGDNIVENQSDVEKLETAPLADSSHEFELTDVDNEEDLQLQMEENFTEISPEEFEAIQEITADVEEMNIRANREGATMGDRTNALANELFGADEAQQKQIAEAQEIIKEKGGTQGFAEFISKRGKGAIAALAFVAGLGGFAQNANAGNGLGDLFKTFNSPAIQKTVNVINGGLNANNRLAEIERNKQSHRDRIDSLIQQRDLLIAQGESNVRVKTIENSIDSQVKPVEMEANFKAQKVQLELKKEESKKRFLEITNPTNVDLAQYEAEQAKHASAIARINGEYQKNVAKEGGRNNVQTAQVEVQTSKANSRIHSVEMQIARLESKIQDLDFQRIKVIQKAGQAMGR